MNNRKIARLLRDLANELDPPVPEKRPRLTPEEAHETARRALKRAGIQQCEEQTAAGQ